jgi:hypothetical protein
MFQTSYIFRSGKLQGVLKHRSILLSNDRNKALENIIRKIPKTKTRYTNISDREFGNKKIERIEKYIMNRAARVEKSVECLQRRRDGRCSMTFGVVIYVAVLVDDSESN